MKKQSKKLKKVFMDTESFGFYGATILIQCRFQGESRFIHDVFHKTCRESLNLLIRMISCDVVGFNLTHDIFHLSRTLNVLTKYAEKFGEDSIPTAENYYLIESTEDVFSLVYKPERLTDLMLIGRKGPFQATMNQKPVTIRKIPKEKAVFLIQDLTKRIKIPELFFSKKGEGKPEWKIKTLHWIRCPDGDYLKQVTPEEMSKFREDPDKNFIEICKDLVDIQLNFHPSTSLKNICHYVLGFETKDYDFPLNNKDELGYFPIHSDKDTGLLQQVIDIWTTDEDQRKYANDDTLYTEEVWNYCVCEEQGIEYEQGLDLVEQGYELNADRTDSSLSGLVGNAYWCGYTVDLPLIKKLYGMALLKEIEYSKEIQYNSHSKVLAWLKESASPILVKLITATNKETLEFLRKEEGEIGRRADLVYKARRNNLELGLLSKLLKAKRFHVSFKVVGTKSNRMAGGSLEGKGKTINPQGIKKESSIRECFTFKEKGQVLCGGDFSGFEISIMEAVYGDPNLRRDLQSGLKIHGIWGSFLYQMTYDEIYATEHLGSDHPEGYYSRSKNSIFAQAYGAATPKICEITGLEEEDVLRATKYFEETYKEVAVSRQKTLKNHQAMVQQGGLGSKITWVNPQEYVESFLGFRRYFTMEYMIIKALFELSNNLPPKYFSNKSIMRGARRQSVTGGVKSAIFAGAFGLQNSIIRAAGNHEIQSPGGQMTKELEDKIWELQPTGIHIWHVKPFNVHDELQVSVLEHLREDLVKIKDDYVEYRKSVVPLIKMDWKDNCSSWKESH